MDSLHTWALLPQSVGSSISARDYSIDTIDTLKSPKVRLNLSLEILKHHTQAYYAQYLVGKFRFDSEYRKLWRVTRSDFSGAMTFSRETSMNWHYGYVSAAYRVSRLLELGTYHGRFYPDWRGLHSPPSGHIFDNAVTARFDLNKYLNLKVEGHFMDGYGEPTSFRGFYLSDNPQGLTAKTNLFVVRLGYSL